jgi:hypothetical protein
MNTEHTDMTLAMTDEANHAAPALRSKLDD